METLQGKNICGEMKLDGGKNDKDIIEVMCAYISSGFKVIEREPRDNKHYSDAFVLERKGEYRFFQQNFINKVITILLLK